MLSAQIAAPESSRRILDPYSPQETYSVAEAALRAGVCLQTIRTWCDTHGVGRVVAGRFKVSKPALEMLLSGDSSALELYHAGKLSHPRVAIYFERCGIVNSSERK